MRSFIQKTYNLVTTKTAVVLIALISVVSGLYTFWPETDIPNQRNEGSHGSINTVGQTGGINIINNASSYRHLNDVSQKMLVEKIDEYEEGRNREFEHIVLTASADSESQNFAKEIIHYLTELNRWKVSRLPIIVFRSDDSHNDIMFNDTEGYGYKNSLAIEIYDKQR